MSLFYNNNAYEEMLYLDDVADELIPAITTLRLIVYKMVLNHISS